MATSSSSRVLAIAARKGIIRSRDLAAEAIPRVVLTRLERAGELVRVGRGLYQLAGADVGAHHSIAAAAARVPRGIVCLLTALRVHDLTTQQPAEIWMAIDVKARKPRANDLGLRVVRFSGKALVVGVELRRLDGVKVKITSPARTVVDCFRYRNKIGLDVALEALRDYRLKFRRKWDELWATATQMRGLGSMRPYLEAVA
jgi:predicted transcriptional regulator of viral defense system